VDNPIAGFTGVVASVAGFAETGDFLVRQRASAFDLVLCHVLLL
jgi:hypothetical protein